jgi:uncharacterized protein YjiS (DUF1127 family)
MENYALTGICEVMQFCSDSQQSCGSHALLFGASPQGTALRIAAQDQGMSVIADHSRSLQASPSFFAWRVCGMGRITLAAIRAWRLHMRQRRELLMLNDVELWDLSLTEADVNHEARESLWKGIQFTDR